MASNGALAREYSLKRLQPRFQTTHLTFRSFQGKSAGLFISTASLGGGQESTAIAAMSTLTHLGIIYVPLGYAKTPQLLELDEIRGGSPWGAGTFSGGDGSRQPTAKELAVAEAQGAYFFETLSKAHS